MREVYGKKQLQGFENVKVDTIAATSDGRKMFVGTGDGIVCNYSCYHQGSTTKGFYGCQKGYQTKEKKAILSLKVVESWGVVMCISDGYLLVFDLDTLQPLNPMPETKGANLFCVNERLSLLCVGMRHKFKLFSWQAGVKGVLVGSLASGFTLRREFPSPESPRALLCTSGCILVGYKKHYDAIDVQAYTSSRLVDFEREHKLVALEVPATSLRKVPVVILSVGIQGVLVDVFGSGVVSNDERLEWSNVPLSAHFGASFIISLVHGDTVEIHDVGSLASLQKIKCGGSSSPLLGLYGLDTGASSSSSAGSSSSSSDSVVAAGGTALLCTPDSVMVLEMIPLPLQVTRLVEKGDLEEALSICHVNKGNAALLEEINLPNIHEKFGSVLYQKGDFDGAVDNYIAAGSDLMDVFALFPDLIPPTVASLVPAMSKKGGGNSSSITLGRQQILGVVGGAQSQRGAGLTGAILHRAASAIVHYCEKKRPQVAADAAQAEYRSRISLASSSSGVYGAGGSSSGGGGGAAGSGSGSAGSSNNSNAAALLELLAEKAENVVPGSPEDLIRRAVLLDTVLVCSLVSSSPLSSTRRQAVIDVLANPMGNRCHIESCAVLLASQGNAFTEALLWLYRSHDEHKRVLSALTEDRCVGSGAWTREGFYQWMGSYLQWMWLGTGTGTGSGGGSREASEDMSSRTISNSSRSSSSSNSSNSAALSLESMVLPALTPLLEYDAVLGMSVLTGVPALADSSAPPTTTTPSTSTTGSALVCLDSSANRGDVSFREVISFLQSIHTPGNELTRAYTQPVGWSAIASASGGGDGSSSSGSSGSDSSSPCFCPMAEISLPLVNGHALSVAYAEWAVAQLTSGTGSGTSGPGPAASSKTTPAAASSASASAVLGGGKASSASITDVVEEYAQLLMAGLRSYLEAPSSEAQQARIASMNHSKNELALQPGDHMDVQLFKIYRSKLQALLQCDLYEYRPERMMKYLPQGGLLHEYALLLSRLGSHDAVLAIYIHQLGEPLAAEAYCDRMYSAQQAKKRDHPHQSSSQMFNNANATNVYLSLIKAKLNLAARSSSSPVPSPLSYGDQHTAPPDSSGSSSSLALSSTEALRQALAVAEKYFDRLDPCAVLDLLPPRSPVHMVSGSENDADSDSDSESE